MRHLSFKALSGPRRRILVARAARLPFAREEVTYPDWYLQRWHFLPEGYLSTRSVRLYDALIRPLYHAGRERTTLMAVVRLLRSRRPRRIVEFGAGPGHALAALAAAFPEAELTGLDLSPFMLEEASKRIRGRAILRQADVSAGSCSSRRDVDAVLAIHVLGHLPAGVARATLRQAEKLLRPGGWLVIVDHRWHRLPLGETRFRLIGVREVGLRLAHLAAYELVDEGASEPPSAVSG